MGADAWLFSVCGVVLVVGGWWLYSYLLVISRRGKAAWLSWVADGFLWVIGLAWALTFLAMAGEFNEYMFGPWPDGAGSFWLRLASAFLFMLGFVGTTARWAWYRGYNRAKEGGKPPAIGCFDF
jgi:hypothetical protein